MRKVINSEIVQFTRRLRTKDAALFYHLYLSSDEAGILDLKGKGLKTANYQRLYPLRDLITIAGNYIVFKDALKWTLSTTLHPTNNGHAKIRKAIQQRGFTYDKETNQIAVPDEFKYN